jgi:CBS domain-containing protein
MNVADVMTSPVFTVDATAELDQAMELMDRHDMRHLPVLEGGGLVGVVSDRDLLEATGWEPAHGRGTHPIRDVMHRPVATVHPDDTVVSATVELVLRKIGCLPVIAGDALVGILTESDLLAAWIRAAREGRLEGTIDPDVDRLMTRDLITLSPRATLADGLALCRSSEVRHLPVVEDGEVVGIVSDRDLRRAQGRNLAGDTPVDKIMTREVVFMGEHVPLHEAADRMVERNIGAVLVLEEGALVGIITLTDLLGHCLEALREPEDA